MIRLIKKFAKKWINKSSSLYALYRWCLSIVQRKQTANPYIAVENNQLVCYRLFSGAIERQISLEHHIPHFEPLSEGLIQPSGIVQVLGKYYDLTQPGVYRFYKLNTLSEQRLIGSHDFEVIGQCLGYLWSYGFEGMLKNNQSLESSLVHKRILIAGCVDIAHIAKVILDSFGTCSRIIAFQTLNPWGGQDDGHTLLEVLDDGGKWFVYDPSFGVILEIRGIPISALDVQRKNTGNHTHFNLLRLPRTEGHSAFRHSNYDYGIWVDEKYHSDECLLEWYRHVCGVALYRFNGQTLFCEEDIARADSERLQSLGFTPASFEFITSNLYD